MLKAIEFDMRGRSSLHPNTSPSAAGTGSLDFSIGEIKSRDPSNRAATKAAKQLYLRLFLLGYAAHTSGVASGGRLTGYLHSSYSSMAERGGTQNALNRFTKKNKMPWQEAHQLPESFMLGVIVA